MKSFLAVRSYRVLAVDIKSLIINFTSALATLETRIKVPILAIFREFWFNLRREGGVEVQILHFGHFCPQFYCPLCDDSKNFEF